MTRTAHLLTLVVVFSVLSLRPADAHHPVAAKYYTDRTQAIEGNLVAFEFRNPHSFVYVEAPDDKGHVQRWTGEWIAGLQLSREAIAGTTLRAGDRVVISGYPSRNPEEHQLRLRTITRPKDGWRWSGNFK